MAAGMLTLMALTSCAKNPATKRPAAPPAPKLVVYIVVDQLPMDLFRRVQPYFEHGLARLTAPEAWVGTGKYAHASTFTCPGHATLSTGASPNIHGIVSNAWMAADGSAAYCGDIDNLLAPTIADRVKANGGLVTALSLKDRGATMLGGSNPDAIAWFDKKSGTWNEGAPEFMDTDGISRALTQPWVARDPRMYARHFPDAQAHEAEDDIGNTFPHPAAGADRPGLFRTLPASGGVLVTSALNAVDDLGMGRDQAADLLTISFSGNDYVGHRFTPQSWEALDAMLVLDVDIGRLLDGLDERLGPENYAVVLSSDHGAANGGAALVDAPAMKQVAQQAYEDAGFEGEIAFGDPTFFLPQEAGNDADARAKASLAIADSLTAIDGIKGAYAWRTRAGIPEDLAVRSQLIEAIHPDRSGDVFVLLEEDTMYSWDGTGQGTSHGTPWHHDTIVPVLMRGAPIHGRSGERVDMRQLAPTVSLLLGVAPPDMAAMPPVISALLHP